MNNIKFNKYNITDGTNKARVHYSRNVSAKDLSTKVIAIYAKDYGNQLTTLFNNVRNDTDLMTDYIETDKVTTYEGSSLYNQLDALLTGWGK